MDAVQLLRDSVGKNILLLVHHNADPDAICSAIALSEGLKQLGCENVKIGAVESTNKLSQKILNKLDCEVDKNPSLDVDVIILLDTSTPGQLSEMAEVFQNSKAEKLMIDHHAEGEDKLIVDHKLVDANATSTVELVCGLLKELGTKISDDVAFALCFGLVAETAHLQFATPDNFRLLADLEEAHSITHQDVLGLLRTPLHVSEKIAHFKALGRAKVHRIGNFLIVTSKVGSFEASCARAMIRVGADLAAVSSRPDELRISLRASHGFVKETGIDLGRELIPEVARIINGSGSGHPAAAGANGSALDKGGEAFDFIINYVRKKIEGN